MCIAAAAAAVIVVDGIVFTSTAISSFVVYDMARTISKQMRAHTPRTPRKYHTNDARIMFGWFVRNKKFFFLLPYVCTYHVPLHMNLCTFLCEFVYSNECDLDDDADNDDNAAACREMCIHAYIYVFAFVFCCGKKYEGKKRCGKGISLQ